MPVGRVSANDEIRFGVPLGRDRCPVTINEQGTDAVLAGDPERALREADIAELAGEANPPPPLQAVLHRVRGYAHLQQSRRSHAVEEFQRSLSAARSGEALYEMALTLYALGRLGDASAAAEADDLLRRLDVAQVAEVPL